MENFALRRCLALSAALASALLAAAAFGAGPSPGRPSEPPSVAFGELYQAVEMTELYPDQKTFADAIPDKSPAQLLADYEQQKRQPGFDLRAFVSRHFALPPRKSPGYEIRSRQSVGDYIAGRGTCLGASRRGRRLLLAPATASALCGSGRAIQRNLLLGYLLHDVGAGA